MCFNNYNLYIKCLYCSIVFVYHKSGEHEGEEKAGLLRIVDASGNNMAHLAAKGNPQCLAYLIEAGVPVSIPNRMGHLPLHVAASNNQVGNAELLIKSILITTSKNNQYKEKIENMRYECSGIVSFRAK